MKTIWVVMAMMLATAASARAEGDRNLGFMQLAQHDGGKTSVFYPTAQNESSATGGPFVFSWAADAPPTRGNGRLIVISHGSGGSPWVHVDLARALVKGGFVVAMPQHQADNYLDHSKPGPESWAKRPLEVSQAIDAVEADPRFSSLLSLDVVGLFGGSAGGHTALVMAGGTWSFSRFRDHCDQNIEKDFSSCVGTITLLNGGWLDGFKVWVAKHIIDSRFSDQTPRQYSDPRIKAAIAMVPFAADFAPGSLEKPRIPLGLIIADKDVNQIPAFHVDAVAKSCAARCEIVMRISDGSHGAMLSPMPPLEQGTVLHHMLADPPGFDRDSQIAELNRRIFDFFVRHLGVAKLTLN